jgi:hypothetical protein
MAIRDLSHYGMLSRAETEFLRGEKQAKPQQLRYLKHCVRRKIRAFSENDLPALLSSEWARPLFQTAIGNDSGGVIDFNSASDLASRTEIYPSRTNDLRARGQVRIKASASGADNRGFESRRARQNFRCGHVTESFLPKTPTSKLEQAWVSSVLCVVVHSSWCDSLLYSRPSCVRRTLRLRDAPEGEHLTYLLPEGGHERDDDNDAYLREGQGSQP